MATVTVNISFQDSLLEEIDAEARRESRSRSELLREAARAYVQRQRRWESVFATGDEAAKRQGLTPNDVAEAISEVRQQTRGRS